MDIKTISTALAVLGTGLNLSACKSSQADATEVPASEHGSEASCGGSNCGASKGDGEGSCGGDKAEAGCGGEAGCSAEKHAEEAEAGGEADAEGADAEGADAEASSASSEVASDAEGGAEVESSSDTIAKSEPAETAAPKKKKTAKKKKKKGTEAACGAGTCG